MTPLAVSLTLAIAMALTATAAFVYLRLTAQEQLSDRGDVFPPAGAGVFPQAGALDRSPATRLIETDCSAIYIPVEGPEFTGSFPPAKQRDGALAPDATRDIRRGLSPDLADNAETLFDKVIVRRNGLADDDPDLEAPTHRYAKPVRARAVFTIPRPLVD